MAVPSSSQVRRGTEPRIIDTPLGAAVLWAEDTRAATVQDLAILVQGTKSTERLIQTTAIRALGRLERRDVVHVLLPFITAANPGGVQREAINAVAQAMRGERLPADAGGGQVEGVLTAFLSAAAEERSPVTLPSFARALGRLPYTRADQMLRAEQMLLAMLQLSSSQLSVELKDLADAGDVMAGGASGLELLARTHRAAYRPGERTVEVLRGIARGNAPLAGGAAALRSAQRPVFEALLAVRQIDDETLRAALTNDDEAIRRLAVLQLAGGGSPVTGSERAGFLREALQDRWYQVRLEAVRGYTRHQAKTDGCLLILQMLSDASEHVVLAALDALGDGCANDQEALDRLVVEAGTPPAVGQWRRQSHALVALARRSPEHLEGPLHTHSRHTTWQVRMYAARAAAIAADLPTLERLALDEHDNVREATLAPLNRLKGDVAGSYFLAALGRSDYQLLRTAARELAGMRVTRDLADALADALRRVTAERRETSRDTRLALLERLREFGGSPYAERLRPLLRDFDRRIAGEAAITLSAWTGQSATPDPQPLPRAPLPARSELDTLYSHDAVLVMESGVRIHITLDATRAPVTSTRFLRLAAADYYDGLTFHRVAPNFVVQGGSPGANEYVGDGPYLRDEISARSHRRGTVGLSTRGRDTGDAQFFINLVDNSRLDFEYTIFGEVTPETLDRIDEIQEGDRIVDVRFHRASR